MADVEDLENAAIELLLKSSLMLLLSVDEVEEESSEEESIKRLRLSTSESILVRKVIRKPNKRVWMEKWREVKQSPSNRLLQIRSYENYIPMGEHTFEKILSYITEDIRKKDTIMRSPVPPAEKLAATLRFLTTGESLNTLNYETGYSNKFLSESIIEVCNAICNRMQDEYIKFPGRKREWIPIVDKYSSRWQFPHCLGALDCKQIQFIPPKRERDNLFVEKSFNSVTLLALADSDCKFTFADIRRYGCINDMEVLERSPLIHILRQGQQHLPPDAVLNDFRSLPYVIIADEAFPLERHLMKPYSEVSNNRQKQVFNIRLNHARQCVERAFGILCNRFRVLQTKIFLNHQKVERLVLCCCILHNFLMEQCTWYREHVLSQEEKDAIGLLELSSRKKPSQPTKYSEMAEPIRANFAEYFMNEGSVPWQQNYIDLNEVTKFVS